MKKSVYLVGLALLLGFGAWLGVKRLSVPAEVAVVGIVPEGRPGAKMCTQVAGTCRGISGQCVSYTDGCQMSKYCATPLVTCDGTPSIPIPSGCHYEQVQCIKAPCNPILVCSSPAPTPTCVPRPQCLDSNPACKIAVPESGWCAREGDPIRPPSPKRCLKFGHRTWCMPTR